MYLNHRYIFLFLVIVMFACGANQSKNTFFEEYLAENFGVEYLQGERGYIILYGSNGCPKCGVSLSKYLADNEKISNITIILSESRYYKNYVSELANKYATSLLIDKNQSIDNYDFGLYSSGALVPKQGSLVAVQFNPLKDSPEEFFKRIKVFLEE